MQPRNKFIMKDVEHDMSVEYVEEKWFGHPDQQHYTKSQTCFVNPSLSDEEIIAGINKKIRNREIKYIIRESDQIIAVLKSTFWTRFWGIEDSGLL